MRSIGKVKIKKLRAIVRQAAREMAPLSMNQYQAKELAKQRIPEDWYDTWESAWSEIERLIDDEMAAILYGREG